MPGVIKLIKWAMTVKTVHYYSTKEWKSIVESWINLYGDSIDTYFIHIKPDVEKTINHKNFKIVKHEP